MKFRASTALLAFVALATSAVGQNSPTVDLMVGSLIAGNLNWQTANGGPMSGTTDDSLVGFGVRSLTTHPGALIGANNSARVVIMARVTTNAEEANNVAIAYPGVDVSDATQSYTLTASGGHEIEQVGGPALEMHGLRTNALFSAVLSSCADSNWATAVPATINQHATTWTNPGLAFPAPNAGAFGLAQPAQVATWTIGGNGEHFWTQSFVARRTGQTTVPGGVMTYFSPSRLIERCILAQSTNQIAALQYIRSAGYRQGFSNLFTLNVQAIILLDPQSIPNQPTGERRKVKLIKTDVYRRQVTLTPGSANGNGGLMVDTIYLRPGIMWDLPGTGMPVCFSLGLGVTPTSVTLYDPNFPGSEMTVPCMPLFPSDVLSPYYIYIRPDESLTSISGFQVSIMNYEPPTGIPQFAPQPQVIVLPPLENSLPLA